MARGIEPKPAWRSVPPPVRNAVARTLNAEVRRAMIAWGGYTPTPTYRLRLVDGRRAFFKAINPAANEFARAAHRREERVYHELGSLIGPWTPAFYGAFECDAWQVLLLEDLGPKSAPPWTVALTRQVARAYGDFHLATLGRTIPAWVPRIERNRVTPSSLEWLTGPDALGRTARLVDGDTETTAAMRWFESAMPTLAQAARSREAVGPPYAFLHRDTRSDNLRWRHGRLRLFDWPHVAVGSLEEDAAAFAQSVAAEDGPRPEQVMAWYTERAPVRPLALDAEVADLAVYFADQAWRPDIPGLPRLRAFQRRQLGITLAWAARRLHLPPPPWLRSDQSG
jgi:hypothetical protein